MVEQAVYMADLRRRAEEPPTDESRPAITMVQQKADRHPAPAKAPKAKASQRAASPNTRPAAAPLRPVQADRPVSRPAVVESARLAAEPATEQAMANPRIAHEPLKTVVPLIDTAPSPLPEAIVPPAAEVVEVFEVFDEETPPAALWPDEPVIMPAPEVAGQDSLEIGLFDYQAIEPPAVQAEPDTFAGEPAALGLSYGPELVADEVLPYDADRAEAAAVEPAEAAPAVFDNEVLDTFEQLLELAYADRAEPPAPGPEPRAELPADQAVPLDPEAPAPIAPNIFEDFVVSHAKPEAAPAIETIIAAANEQPLEETFVQLSFYLAETPSDAEHPVLRKTLQELAELVSPDSDDAALEEEVAITPQLTQQLLTLLRAVGYDNPREVLLAFVQERNFEFLVQAVRHLSQLCNDDNRHELLHKQAAMLVATSDASLAARLGGAILSLILGNVPRAVLKPAL